MDWSLMSVSRDRILSDSGNWKTYLESYLATPPNDPWAYTATRSYMSDKTYRRCWDLVTPNWKAEMNKGVIICNDLLDVSLKSVFSPMMFQCKLHYPNANYVTDVVGGFGHGVNGASGIIAPPQNFAEAINLIVEDEGSLRSEVVTKSFAKVDVSELEVLASLGEMPETVEWFRDVLRRLIGIIADFKKRRYLAALNRLKPRKTSTVPLSKRAKKRLLQGEDGWMELRYAIRPLVFEVQAYLAALDSKVEKAVRKTARSRNFDVSLSNSSQVFSGPYLPFFANVTRKSTLSRSVSAGVLYNLQADKMGWWTHLGLDAPISAVWAVTTLSFVFDWFFNIGQWIASWEPRVGLTPLANWVVETRTQEIVGSSVPQGVVWPPQTVLSWSVTDAGEYSCVLQVKARWKNPDRQILPTWNFDGLKVAQVADLVIIGRKLTAQLFR